MFKGDCMDFIPFTSNNFEVRLAKTKAELEEVYKLRYKDLLLYYNANNTNDTGLFKDEYDGNCDDLIVIDLNVNEIVGTYRLIRKEHITKIGAFITESEYDISKLKKYEIMELGRAVVREDYRNGSVIMLLWRGLTRYAINHNIRFMFGTGSFQGINPGDYKHALSYIYFNHLSEEKIRVQTAKPPRSPMNLLPVNEIDPILAKKQIPPLIKGYIKIGATFGEDAFLDIPFNSLDVFVLLDVEKVDYKYIHRFS